MEVFIEERKFFSTNSWGPKKRNELNFILYIKFFKIGNRFKSRKIT